MSPTKTNEPEAIFLFRTRIPVPPQDSSSLASKEDESVSLSPTKRNEPKTITLFGTVISVQPQDSSSLASKATLMPLTDVTISPTKKRSLDETLDGFCLGSNPKEMSLFSASRMKTDKNLKTHCLFNAESSKNPNKELKKDARKIKKMRSLSNKEREGLKPIELDLNIPPGIIRKELTASDVGDLSRILLEKSHAESYILSHLTAEHQKNIQDGKGVKVKVYDRDTSSEHDLVLKRMVKTTRSYIFNGGWVKKFVKRRDLKEGHEIELFWNSFEYRLHFWVLSPVPA